MKKFTDLEKGDKIYYVNNLDSYEKGIIKKYDVVKIINSQTHFNESLGIIIDTPLQCVLWVENRYKFDSVGIEFVDQKPSNFILGPYVATSETSLHEFIKNCSLIRELEKKIKLR